MDNFNVDSLGLPLGKYIDPNVVNKLKLIKYELIEDIPKLAPPFNELYFLGDELYLIEDTEHGKYYCCYGPDEPNAASRGQAVTLMEQWLKDRLVGGGRVKLLEPKNEDWYLSHYLAEVDLP